MNFNALDLNLLRLFEALLAEGSVTAAAARIGVSQPAASNALLRLRRTLGDSLFERRGRRMAPTTRARALALPIGRALQELRGALGALPSFDSRSSTRTFSIATVDWLEGAWLPSAVRATATEAPGVRLAVRRLGYQFVVPAEELAAGELDLAIGQFSEPTPQSGILSRAFARERFVCVVRSGHPVVSRRLTLRQFISVPQIRIVASGPDSAGFIDRVLDTKGLARRVGLSLPHFLTVPDVVRKSDLLGVVPARLVAAESGRGLALFDPPLDLGFPPVRLAWHESARLDPARAWLLRIATRALEEPMRRSRARLLSRS